MTKSTSSKAAGAAGALIGVGVLTLLPHAAEFSWPLRVLLAAAVGGVAALALEKISRALRKEG